MCNINYFSIIIIVMTAGSVTYDSSAIVCDISIVFVFIISMTPIIKTVNTFVTPLGTWPSSIYNFVSVVKQLPYFNVWI